jgi:hypothetical protein
MPSSERSIRYVRLFKKVIFYRLDATQKRDKNNITSRSSTMLQPRLFCNFGYTIARPGNPDL